MKWRLFIVDVWCIFEVRSKDYNEMNEWVKRVVVSQSRSLRWWWWWWRWRWPLNQDVLLLSKTPRSFFFFFFSSSGRSDPSSGFIVSLFHDLSAAWYPTQTQSDANLCKGDAKSRSRARVENFLLARRHLSFYPPLLFYYGEKVNRASSRCRNPPGARLFI